ncbi:MAG: PspC domain-containing protein [Ruminococcus sp.]|nr:PspC domain-containing protein [Ruminococcus sp.]
MKRIFRSKRNRMICGVCGGIGEYMQMDPNVIRLLAILFGCTGAGVIAYIAAAIILPEAAE